MQKKAPSVGIEPTTIGLKGQRSTIWAKKALLRMVEYLNLNSSEGNNWTYTVTEASIHWNIMLRNLPEYDHEFVLSELYFFRSQYPTKTTPFFMNLAAIAQLGERQTEDLKVPGSIPGLGTFSRGPQWNRRRPNRASEPPAGRV